MDKNISFKILCEIYKNFHWSIVICLVIDYTGFGVFFI
jgi:hypothetical protein